MTTDRPATGTVALVGLSGTGKSTMAPDLARRLGLGCVDIDRRIEERFGATVAAVFEEQGEPGFRTLESEVLAEALDGDPVVIATGGGIVLSAENRRRLVAESVVVWLRASPELLVARLTGATEVRPLLRGDAESALRQLSAERDALYLEVAAIVVDCDDATSAELLDRVEVQVRHAAGLDEREPGGDR